MRRKSHYFYNTYLAQNEQNKRKYFSKHNSALVSRTTKVNILTRSDQQLFYTT